MTENVNVAPGEATQNTTPVADEQSTEVVTPEPQTEDQQHTPDGDAQPEKDERDRTIKRMERRISQKHAQAAAAEERARLLEERLARFEAPANQGEPKAEDKKAPSREEIDAYVQSKAQALLQAKEVSDRANKAWQAGVKAFGEAEFKEAAKAVMDEVSMFDKSGMPTAFGEAVMDSDHPEKLIKHLADHPDLIDELADLSPVRLAKRIERIERDMAAPPKQSSAPKPLQPVKPSAASAMPDPANTEAWIAWRRKQREQ